jgi:AraC family transcriptional regulator
MSSSHGLRSPHNVRVSKRSAKAWNGVAVESVEFLCTPARACWHDITGSQPSLYIVLDQMGGRCEARTRIDQPNRSEVSGRQYIDFVPAGVPMWGYSDGIRKARIAQYTINFKLMEDTLGERINWSQIEIPRLRFFDARIVKIGSLLAEECEEPGNNNLYGDHLTVALVIDLLRLGRQCGRDRPRGMLESWQLNRATEFIQDHLSTNIRLSELAQLTKLSQSQFGRAFKASTGFAPHQWQLNARIARAQQLLLDGDLSLSEIALSTGFSEHSHFSRVFRKVVGASPGFWQRDKRR